MKIRFIPEAEADFLEAHGWYHEQGQGLAYEFQRSVEACLAAVTEHSDAFPRIHKNLRRALVRRFPYGLFYVIAADEIVVIGCLHVARDPKE